MTAARLTPFAGLQFFTRCSDGSLNLVSRHWPNRLCWSWIIGWSRLPRGMRHVRFWRIAFNHGSQQGVDLWFWCLRLHTQNYIDASSDHRRERAE